ncbi:MucBP domain-containing protein, partial [Pediococcus acidilactici]|nr:MucBP domain-containing protein [Pediococcus acidilactici]
LWDDQIQHTVTVKIVDDETLKNDSIGTMLDTMLDDNDDISLYASGNGGVFIKNDELTLYVEALRNAHVYAGQWNGSESDIADRLKVSGNYGKSLINDVDSAVQYETDFLNLAKGQSYIYSYVERLFTAHESLGQVTVHYVDENGNKIHDDKVLGNIVGEGFDEQPISIDGYVFSRTLGNAKGVFSKDPQNITFVYTHKEVTPAENNPETPSQDKPENPSAPSTDENKPAEPSVSAPDVQMPEAPRNNNVIPTNVNHVTSVTPTQVTNKPQLTENNVKQTNSVTLPQTNENPRSASLLTTIGLVISGMIATLGLTIKRRHG